MIEETGEVVEIEGDFAWIESERSTTCGGCAARKGCGTSVIAKVLGSRRVRLRVLNRINASVGDPVVIGIPESGLLRGSLAVYAVPLLALFGGALAGNALGGLLFSSVSELAAIAGGIAGFGAGLAWLKRFSRRTRTDELYQPVVLRQHFRVAGE